MNFWILFILTHNNEKRDVPTYFVVSYLVVVGIFTRMEYFKHSYLFWALKQKALKKVFLFNIST